MRLSIVTEWANTRLNGIPRAWLLFDALAEQWRAIRHRVHPDGLPPGAAELLARFEPRVEIVVASGTPEVRALEDEIRARLPPEFDLRLLVADGCEYYPLKNEAARIASGDVLLFVDSDVLPDPGWMAHLVGSFARPDVDVICGQTYVAPTTPYARAFALGWTYLPRRDDTEIVKPSKFYANTIAFRTEVFRSVGGFADIGRKTRGAASLMRAALGKIGVSVWENPRAAVAHPPPANFSHLAVRAIAHGRDQYMKHGEERHLGGLGRSVGIAMARLGRGWYRTLRHGHRVGLPLWEVPYSFTVTGTYHAFFALGGILTHVSPTMMGRRFRV